MRLLGRASPAPTSYSVVGQPRCPPRRRHGRAIACCQSRVPASQRSPRWAQSPRGRLSREHRLPGLRWPRKRNPGAVVGEPSAARRCARPAQRAAPETDQAHRHRRRSWERHGRCCSARSRARSRAGSPVCQATTRPHGAGTRRRRGLCYRGRPAGCRPPMRAWTGSSAPAPRAARPPRLASCAMATLDGGHLMATSPPRSALLCLIAARLHACGLAGAGRPDAELALRPVLPPGRHRPRLACGQPSATIVRAGLAGAAR